MLNIAAGQPVRTTPCWPGHATPAWHASCTNLEEDPVNIALHDTCVEVPEAVQHPGLLVVSQVLDGQIVTQRVAGLKRAG